MDDRPMRVIPFTLPSLAVCSITLPKPMKQDDYDFMLELFGKLELALTAAAPDPSSTKEN